MCEEKTVSERLVDYVLSINYADLPSGAITDAKRLILDGMGHSIVGSQASYPKMVAELAMEAGGPEESTIIAGGKKVWGPNAALANGISLRYPEYCGGIIHPEGLIAMHVEENIPSALAICEKLGLGGKDLITATVLGAEIQGRFAMVADMEYEAGIRHTTSSIFSVPLIVGKLMGLDREQMVNAFGISASFGITLNESHSGPNVYTARDLAFPLGAHNGIRAALLAQKGFTGPPTVIEGDWGFLKVLGDEGIRARARLSKLFEEQEGFLINKYRYKLKCGDGTVQSPGDAVLDIQREHKIDPKDVKEIKVYMGNWYDTAFEARRRPINKSDADHSLWYTIGRALIDGDLQFPEQYTPEKISDPEVNELMDKINLYIDPQMMAEQRKLGLPASISYVEVHMKDGSVYHKRRLYARGYGPFWSPEAVEELYNSLATKYLKQEVVAKIRETVNSLENLADVGELMDLVRSF